MIAELTATQSARPNFTMSAAGWLRVLCVAHRYDCSGMHARALDGIRAVRFQKGQDTEALACAEQHDIDVRLVEDALKHAIMRTTTITAEELATLTPMLASKLCAAREKWAVDSALHNNSPEFGTEPATQGKTCERCKVKYCVAPNIQKVIASIWGRKYVYDFETYLYLSQDQCRQGEDRRSCGRCHLFCSLSISWLKPEEA